MPHHPVPTAHPPRRPPPTPILLLYLWASGQKILKNGGTFFQGRLDFAPAFVLLIYRFPPTPVRRLGRNVLQVNVQISSLFTIWWLAFPPDFNTTRNKTKKALLPFHASLQLALKPARWQLSVTTVHHSMMTLNEKTEKKDGPGNGSRALTAYSDTSASPRAQRIKSMIRRHGTTSTSVTRHFLESTVSINLVSMTPVWLQDLKNKKYTAGTGGLYVVIYTHCGEKNLNL